MLTDSYLNIFYYKKNHIYKKKKKKELLNKFKDNNII